MRTSRACRMMAETQNRSVQCLPGQHLEACLAATAAYVLIVAAAIALRVEAHRFGLLLSKYTVTALHDAMVFHAVGAVIMIVLLVVARRLRLHRPWLAKLALTGMSVVFMISLDRLLGTAYEPFPEDVGLFMPHPRRGWTLRPGWVGRDERAAIRINSRGFRGPEVIPKGPARETHILFLGDSVTFGSHVEEEACFTTRVEAMANRRGPSQPVTAINASVPAYSPWQEYDLLADEGLQCDPDYVVLVFCLNDVLEKYQLQQYGGYSRGYEPPVPSRFEWSGWYRAARTWRAAMARPTNDELWHLRGAYSARRLLNDPDAPEVHEAWKTTLADLEKIVSVLREKSLPLAMVCSPHGDQVSPDPPKLPPPQAVLAAFAEQHGIPFLDLLPVFRQEIANHGIDPATFFYDPLHLAPAGHELAAGAIFDILRELGWLG